MKHILTIILSLYILTVSGQTDNQITERIIYTVRFDDKTGKENGLYQHLDAVTKKQIINEICDLVYQGKLGTCNYWGDKIGELPDYFRIEKLANRLDFKWNDSIIYHPKSTKKLDNDTRDGKVYRYLINSLSFQEQWYFDKTTNQFTKKINGVILFQDKYTHNVGMWCSNYVPLNDTSKNEYNPKFLVAKNIIYDVPITKTDKENCNDYNWWHNYIEASKREKFLDLLTNKALYDTITPLQVYKPVFPFDSLMPRSPYFFNTGLSLLYHGRANWYSSDPLVFGMTDEKIQACCFELSDWTTVKAIRFHEDWYFDNEKLRFEKKVLGIGLIVNTFNDKGQITGDKCLVYYKIN